MNEYDLNSNYYNPYYCKQTDELSLILGFEYMPACLDLNSPSSNTSSNATTSSSSSHPSTGSADFQPYSVCVPQTSKSKPSVHTTTQQHPQQQQQRVFRIQTQNSVNCFNSNVNLINNACETDAPATSALKKVNSSTGCSNLIACSLVDTSTTVPPTTPTDGSKKKKKCPKTKGTSLLAQPAGSIKANNSTTLSSSQQISKLSVIQQQAPFITINRSASIAATTLSPLHQQKLILPKSTTILSSTTKTVTPITSTASQLTDNLTPTDRILKYCVKIEHSYSLMC